MNKSQSREGKEGEEKKGLSQIEKTLFVDWTRVDKTVDLKVGKT